MFFQNTILLLTVFTLTSCSTYSVESRKKTAQDLANRSNLSPFSIPSAQFGLAGYSKITAKGKPVTVYIEGDGFAWLDRYTVSSNPTPRNPVALKLAIIDDAPNKIYLARPCQYLNLETELNCENKYWTSHRFSEDVIKTYDDVLTKISTAYQVKGYHLNGYSGGGAIVTLLASRRTDILSVKTIAGNLDHASLANFHNATPLSGSVNPIKYAKDLASIPQIHYAGALDKVVPPWIAGAYSKLSGINGCSKLVIVDSTDHYRGWVETWPMLSDQKPSC